jgi:hypothetical protein
MKKEIGNCPIQMVDCADDVNARWVTLRSQIDLKTRRYKNLVVFHRNAIRGNNYALTMINKIFKDGLSGNIVPKDIIRNPTFTEINEIKTFLRDCNCRYNRKKDEFIELQSNENNERKSRG